MQVHGHSGKYVAEQLDIAPSSVSRYISGTIDISPKMRKKISKFYNVDVVEMSTIDFENSSYVNEETDKYQSSTNINDLIAMYESLKKENELLRERNELLEKIFNETLKK